MRTLVVSLTLLASFGLSSCTGSRAVTAPAPATCTPTVVDAHPAGGAEAQARSVGNIEVHALIFNTWQLPARGPLRVPAEAEFKIVWRATGDGVFVVEATGPTAETVRPVWGPEAHTGSSWNQPGDEWGTGWSVPTPGCWSFRIQRGDATATLNAEAFASTR